MSRIILVTGGARSGKSRWAEERIESLIFPWTYIATAEPRDGEMRERINAHIARRGPNWTTIEEPFDLSGALTRSDGTGARLVDCVTFWLTNLMLADHDWQAALTALTDTLEAQTSPVILVTNEVGAGIVPDNALARRFRDAAGAANQAIAAVSAEVVLVSCGLPLILKNVQN
ncbi:bifunctional adenosylcobinamide kinase/adenosylcobinamide-phosphate guanylyltransferase [Amaricoccus tamworthensis]|uniref:bifunctional adenosylcobinamide kinase/adenosylcobinamide-phosphate guanylyltransferase n=1 Tax=Amaricoccus tamworthensis TaxID=57002 RepID=UPI003C7E0816